MNAYSISAFILLATIATASAENSPPIPKTKISPDVDVIGEGQILGKKEAVTVVLKWNTIHAATCVAGNVSNKPSVKLYGTQSEGVSLTGPFNFPSIQAMMVAQCATGNWVSFYVTKITGNTFSYNALQSWDYK
jgi:hypothetical protein